MLASQPVPAGRARERADLAVAMAIVAGCVDGVGYLVLSHVFTAHMSGNSVAFGVDLGARLWTDVLRRGFPVPIFVLGVGAGGVIIEAGMRHGYRRTMSLVLAIESLLLAGFLLGGRAAMRGGAIPVSAGATFYALVASLTLAMGLQTAALQRVGGHTVRTTYVTGMLTRFAEETVVFAFWFHDERKLRGKNTMRAWAKHVRAEQRLNRALLLAGIWCGYLTGAVTGAALDRWVNEWAILPALAIIAVIVVIDQRRPIHGPLDVQAAVGS